MRLTGRVARRWRDCNAVMKMGDYMDAAAALYGLPPPPRLQRAALEHVLSPMQMSFLAESRRMDNRRIKRELRLVLRYPSVLDGLAAGLPQRST